MPCFDFCFDESRDEKRRDNSSSSIVNQLQLLNDSGSGGRPPSGLTAVDLQLLAEEPEKNTVFFNCLVLCFDRCQNKALNAERYATSLCIRSLVLKNYSISWSYYYLSINYALVSAKSEIIRTL